MLSKACKSGLKSRFCAVLGGQWGDEGKGKLTDILAQKYDICARFNGGDNAGHTIVHDGQKFAFHILPSGMLNEKCLNVLGNGTVVNISSLEHELKQLNERNVCYKNRLVVSSRAHLIVKDHVKKDGQLEGLSGDKKLGTTNKGIGPTYAAKAYRTGLRIGDLVYWDSFLEKYNRLRISNGLERVENNEELDNLKRQREFLINNNMITDTVDLLNQAIKSEKRVLAEGANACMLDIDYGTYPYVTSSSCSVGGIFSGLGVAPKALETAVGIVKAYTTRVGEGPFPSEMKGEEEELGIDIRTRGFEKGVTTGRNRRIGWLDLGVVKYTNTINGYNSINLTKLDILDPLPSIKIGVGYRNKKTGAVWKGSFPSTLEELDEFECLWETLPGWEEDISSIKEYEKLPKNCKKYIERIEQFLKVPVSWIGTGPDREQMIVKH